MNELDQIYGRHIGNPRRVGWCLRFLSTSKRYSKDMRLPGTVRSSSKQRNTTKSNDALANHRMGASSCTRSSMNVMDCFSWQIEKCASFFICMMYDDKEHGGA